MRRLGLLLLLFIAAIGGFSAWLDHQISRLYRGYSGSSIFVDIPRGTSRWHVAEILRENGVIPNAVAFDLLSRWHHNRSLQAGEYLFDHSMNEREVFWKIAGGHIYVHSVQITEGWTMFEIADALEREGLANREDFLKVARDPTPIQDLDPGAKSLEGFLFPSTYEFTRRATPQQIADAMVRHFRTVWASLNPDPANPAATTQQIVTIASLVERETPVKLRSARSLQAFSTIASARTIRCNATPRSNTPWLSPGGRRKSFTTQTWRSIRRTIPTGMQGSRRGPLPIPARRPCGRQFRRQRRISCIL